MAKITPPVNIRDFQRDKVYRAENLASQLINGNVWKQTLDEDEVVELVNKALTHPNIVARWGQKNVRVVFDVSKRTEGRASAIRNSGLLTFSPTACSPMLVLHEVAHLLATKDRESFHGVGFCAVLHYLFIHIISEEAGRTLIAAYKACGAKIDHEQLLPVRKGSRGHTKWDITGASLGEPARAASILRNATSSGLFNDDEELRVAAYRIARKLDTANAYIPIERTKATAIPKVLRINVDALGDYDQHDFLEAILAAIRDTDNIKKIKNVKVEYALPVMKEVANRVAKQKKEENVAEAKAAKRKVKPKVKVTQTNKSKPVTKTKVVQAARRKTKPNLKIQH